jgi:hypothetical protein
MAMKPFDGPKLKLKRAIKHVAEIESEVIAFSKSHPQRIITKLDGDTEEPLVEQVATDLLPREVSLLMGDAIHNLRTALDFAWIEAIRKLEGRAAESSTEFPVGKSREDLLAALNGIRLRESWPDLFSYIVSDLQPYHGGKNEAVWCLHELDIIDKHRLLMPVFHWSAVSGPEAEDDRHRLPDLAGVRTLGRPKIERFPASSGARNEGRPSFEIQFEAGIPLEAAPIIPTLKQLTRIVYGIVIALETVYLARADLLNPAS